MELNRIHHAAIIASNYEISKHFYHDILGLEIIAENYRQNRNSWKLDLGLPDGGQIELFSFPNPPARLTQPEAQGLRHLAFEVDDIEKWTEHLSANKVAVQNIRTDEFTGARFVFFTDPDELPLELYERIR